MNKFHPFTQSIDSIALPKLFTYPFQYTPHPLCVKAAEELQAYLKTKKEWQTELQKGKMFGVLLVRNEVGEIGYLAAFSGILAGRNLQDYFVPPVYDVQDPTGYFYIEEKAISAINQQIDLRQKDSSYLALKLRLSTEKQEAKQALEEMKAYIQKAKEKREKLRQQPLSPEQTAALIRKSQFQKAELKRQKQFWEERLSRLQTEIDTFEEGIERLKTERKTRSAALQQWLFKQFQMLNAYGEKQDLCTLFKDTAQGAPPAGAGECAAPKLLQFAYQLHLEPLAMAEFWWGDSPKNEIRRHGCYYPACKGKCEPILKHMLQGLSVEENPLLRELQQEKDLEIVYEDDALVVVNKPVGMLSVPGKLDVDSVYQRMKRRYPEATGPMIVHRLDMATSGLLLIAKTKEAHQNLQAQFKNRIVQKRYVALLSEVLAEEEGKILLPLRPDPEDRPRQVVDRIHGKTAITHYQVIGRGKEGTRVFFYPQTGRTHQLRVHAAHPSGLNAPIIGDELYGKKAERLYLHAEYIAFHHPISGQWIEVEKKADF
ncbi:MAG: RNA pseudouridine synthase [Parabacteroides sp.]|nr:RNA pseudouridine synthase [Parabacteroides sp.]